MKQDSQVPGLNEVSRRKRNRRNIVTMKFNMINWSLETLINISALSTNALLQHILYVTTMSLGTPLVYVMGIEENRKLAKEHFKQHIRIFKKNNKVEIDNNNVEVAQESSVQDQPNQESSVQDQPNQELIRKSESESDKENKDGENEVRDDSVDARLPAIIEN